MMDTANSMDQIFLEKVHSAIEKNYSDQSFNVDHLAREIGISRYQLSRKLKVISGQSPSQMIKEFRLQKAFELLQMRFSTISEIAYQVGFSSPSYFNTCFREYFGYPPGKVKPSSSVGILKRCFQNPKAKFVSLATGFIAILILFYFILSLGRDPARGKARGIQTSIAVLPFAYLSENPGDQYLADAMMEEIILQLSYNQKLRVMPRISVEQYKSKERNVKQIARELDVDYILDGSLQKQGDRVNVNIDLIHARTSRIEWKKQYPGNWNDILTIQSQIAQRITGELDIEITPDVKQIMEKPPTTSPDAADFYWRGNNELNKFNTQDSIVLERAYRLFHEAIKVDSTYARAYVGLARIYWTKHYWDTFLSEDFAGQESDSVLILANQALSFDRQLAEAYVLRGAYYKKINNKEQALKDYDKAISLNPSSAEAYRAKAELYFHEDLVNRIENLHKAAELERGEGLPDIYRDLGWGYGHAGFKEIASKYIKNALELDGDSTKFYMAISEIEHEYDNFNLSIDLAKKSYSIDSTYWWKSYLIGLTYSFLDNPEESLKWFKRFEEILSNSGSAITRETFFGTYRLAHAYGINGFENEANYYLTEGLALYNRMIALNRHFRTDIMSFYSMAALYAFQGNKEEAYGYLNRLNSWQRMPLWVILNIHYDPMFDSLREEPQFQQIVRELEAKYQAEHERVSQWLEENDML